LCNRFFKPIIFQKETLASSSSEQLFENAFRYAAIGMALVGRDGRFLRVNRSLCELVGYSEDELLRLTFQDITHPDDLDADLSHLQKLIRGEIETYRMEKRYLHRDGREIWILLSVSAVRDDNNEIEFFISQIKDITESKRAETALRSASARLTALVMNFPAGILVEDENRRIVLANQSFCEMFDVGVSPDKLGGADCARVLENTSRQFHEPEKFVQRTRELLNTRRTIEGDELHLLDGRTLERDCLPIYAQDAYFGHLWSYRDITDIYRAQALLEKQTEQLQKANIQLQRQATTDELTGLSNRRALFRQLETEWQRAARSGGSVCLVMLDLDFFKSYNDSFGHQAGDAVLQKTASLLQLQTRTGDLVARYGGEEFAIVLPETSLEDANDLAERFRQALESDDWALRPVTASFGVACVVPSKNQSDAQDKSISALIARADAALYQAKQTGRNRVCVAPAA
jgi:diguanylate cyclase (GGDEF)-like protein/PAS domain S-box-containing protein